MYLYFIVNICKNKWHGNSVVFSVIMSPLSFGMVALFSGILALFSGIVALFSGMVALFSISSHPDNIIHCFKISIQR
jgi:hypothetical protein